TSPGPRYRLKRRGLEAARILRQYAASNPSILDLGTADGLMLDYVAEIVKPCTAVGVDLSMELLQINARRNPVVLADGEALPFPGNAFDAVIATAVIEHVPHPNQFVSEIYRVLNPEGVCIITTPVPLFEELATKFGFLKEDDHQETFTLKKASDLLLTSGFQLLESEKFMMSPVGFPAEQMIERFMKKVGLSSLLLNQLVAARRL
ncbi:MAG TPA: class I SAM-dependent methyltransferase, partial [Acidobacteriota bacterium]|nr:class I SAM-dependent methyltransferase [Acidobacteriota bacterium]